MLSTTSSPRLLSIFACVFVVFAPSVNAAAIQEEQKQQGSSVLDSQPEPAVPAEEPKQAKPEPKQTKPELKKPLDPADEKFQALVKKCNAAMQDHYQRAQSADPADRAKIKDDENPANRMAGEFLAIADQHPTSNGGYHSISFLVVNGSGEIKAKAIKRLVKDYGDDSRIVKSLTAFTIGSPTPETEKILSQLSADSKNKTVRGHAMRTHIEYLRSLLQIKQLTDDNPELANQFGTDVMAFLKKHDIEAATKRETELLTKLAEEFADVPSGSRGKSLADIAKSELFNRKNLSPGAEAPNIIGHDFASNKMQLTDFRGKVVLLVFWGNWSRESQLMYPQLRSLNKKLKDKPFQIVGVNTDTSHRMIAATMKHLKLDWKNFWQKGKRGKYSNEWQIKSWPSVFIIDTEGIIRHKNINSKTIDKVLTKMMKELSHEVDLSDHSDGRLSAPTPKKPPTAPSTKTPEAPKAKNDK